MQILGRGDAGALALGFQGHRAIAAFYGVAGVNDNLACQLFGIVIADLRHGAVRNRHEDHLTERCRLLRRAYLHPWPQLRGQRLQLFGMSGRHH